jgi:hypothetical protein
MMARRADRPDSRAATAGMPPAMLRATAAICTTCLAVAIAGCGSDGDDPAAEAEAVALEWTEAVAADRLDDACALMTDTITAESEFNETDSLTCETALGSATGAVPDAPDSASGELTGGSATVTVTGAGEPVVVELVDEGGEWKVDEF